MKKIIGFVLLCLFAVSCASVATPTPAPTQTVAPTRALKSGKIRYLHLVNVDVRFVPTFMALDELQAQGYTIERTALANSTLIVDALSRGDAEIGTLNPQTMWAAIAKGANARTFVQGIPTVSLSMAKAEIKTCADLDGKRVAFAAATGLSPTQFDLYVKANCPNIKPTRVVIAESDARVAALLKGEIDSSQLPLESVLQLERQAPGKFVRLIDYVKEFPNLLTGVLNVRQDWAKQNPEIVKDFLRALLNAHRRIVANPQVLYDEAVKRLNITPAEAKEAGAADLQYAMWDVNGGVTKENIQATLDFLAQINQVPATLKADDVADLSYLNAVLADIGRK